MIKKATTKTVPPLCPPKVQFMNLQQPIKPSKPNPNTPDVSLSDSVPLDSVSPDSTQNLASNLANTDATPPENSLSQECAAILMETMHPIMQFMRAEMRSQREPSLSVPQFRLLAFLNRHPGASLSEVSEHLGVTRATASAMTERLVQRHWVNRMADPQERRQVMLTLTELGHTHLKRMQDSTRQRIAELLAQLSTEELADVSAGLTILSQVFQSV